MNKNFNKPDEKSMKGKILTLTVAVVGSAIVVSTAITMAWLLAVIMGR